MLEQLRAELAAERRQMHDQQRQQIQQDWVLVLVTLEGLEELPFRTLIWHKLAVFPCDWWQDQRQQFQQQQVQQLLEQQVHQLQLQVQQAQQAQAQQAAEQQSLGFIGEFSQIPKSKLKTL